MGTYELSTSTLDNGLTVLIVTDPTTPLAAARTYVRAGAITEESCLGQGISHFLEHLVAGGPTAYRTESEYQTALSLLGGGYNAYTTTDHTCYYINTIPETIQEAITILSEWMFHNTFTTLEFEREREVITREIEKNNAELGRVFYQTCQQHFYHHHPMRYPVIGYLENFKATTMAQLKAYYAAHYVPSNMILVVGSPYQPEVVMPWVQSTFGAVPPAAPPNIQLTSEPIPFTGRVLKKPWQTASTYYSMRFATTDLFSPDLPALDLLDFMLSNGEESLLIHDIVDQQQLAFSLSSSSMTPTVTTGYFDFTAELNQSDMPKVRDAILSHLNRIKNGDVDHRRIQRAKKQKLAEEAFSISTIEDLVSRVGQGQLYAQSPRFYDTYLDRFRAVTSDDVIRVAQRYFDETRIVETVLTPIQVVPPATAPSVVPTIVVPALQLPTKHVMPNGLRVLVFPERSAPRVHVKLFFDGGLRRETPGVNGIGHVLADVLGTATHHRTKSEIGQIFEDRGADTGASIGNHTLYTSMDCMSEDLPELMPLFVETILDAVFVERELAESKRQTLNWIAQRRDDWHRYAAYQFRQQFYEGHPYGLPIIGEVESVAALTTTQLTEFYRDHLDPSRMVLTVFGDVAVEAIPDLVGRLGQFQGEKPAIQLPDRALHVAPSFTQRHVDQDVAAVFVGFDGVKLGDDTEAMRLDLVNTVLSGMNYPGGRLHHLLRDEGLVYMVHAVNFFGLTPGHFLIYALTSDPHQQRVQDIIDAQIRSIKTHAISQLEFDQAIAQMRFYFKDRIASLESLSTIAAIDELIGRGFDHYARISDHVDALTIPMVQRYAQQYLINPQTVWFNKASA